MAGSHGGHHPNIPPGHAVRFCIAILIPCKKASAEDASLLSCPVPAANSSDYRQLRTSLSLWAVPPDAPLVQRGVRCFHPAFEFPQSSGPGREPGGLCPIGTDQGTSHPPCPRGLMGTHPTGVPHVPAATIVKVFSNQTIL